MCKQSLIKYIDSIQDILIDIAQKIWDNPEKLLQEEFTYNLQVDFFKKNNFKVTAVKNVPNAFVVS